MKKARFCYSGAAHTQLARQLIMAEQLVAMGFSLENAQRALARSGDDAQRAANLLLENNGAISSPDSSDSEAEGGPFEVRRTSSEEGAQDEDIVRQNLDLDEEKRHATVGNWSNVKLEVNDVESGSASAESAGDDAEAQRPFRLHLELSGHPDWVMACAWAPGASRSNRSFLVSGGIEHAVKVWQIDPDAEGYGEDAESGEKLFKPPELAGHCYEVKLTAQPHSNWIRSVDTDGNVIVSGGDDEKLCQVDFHTGQVVKRTLNAHRGYVYCTKLVPSDPHVVVTGGGDGLIKVWDLRDNADSAARVFRGHDLNQNVNEVCIFEDLGDPLIYSACDDGTVRCWDFGTGRTISRASHNASQAAVCMLRPLDGTAPKVVSGGEKHEIDIWEIDYSGAFVDGGVQRYHVPGENSTGCRAVGVSRGDCIISGGSISESVCFDIHSATLTHLEETIQGEGVNRTKIKGLSVSEDGSALATVGNDSEVRVYYRDGGATLTKSARKR